MEPQKSTEPRNPLYFVLLGVCLIFVMTAMAYAVVPWLEEKAKDAGQMPPPSPFRDSLREHGWLWLLIEVLAMIVVGFASMIFDKRLWNKTAEKTLDEKATNAPT